MAKMGRPKIEIDQRTFESLCEIQCTLSEVASVCHCSEDTIERWCKRTYKQTFAEVYKKYSDVGKASLRRTQLKLAQKNASMAIFLGKQYLGQSDAITYENDDALKKLDDILGGLRAQADSLELE